MGSLPSWLLQEPVATYEARRAQRLTAHALAMFRKCPQLFRRQEEGLIPDRDRAAYRVGRAAHALILEGRETFERRYAVGGPINPRTGNPYGKTSQKFQDWAVAQGEKEVLSDAEAATVEEMAASVAAHPLAPRLLSQGQAEGVVRANLQEVPCQARLDFVHEEGPELVDLKTARNLDTFEQDFHLYHYAHQLAFYRALVQAAGGPKLPVYVVTVEKVEPFRTGTWRLGDEVLAAAARENAEAIAELKACRGADTWPTRYEALRPLTLAATT